MSGWLNDVAVVSSTEAWAVGYLGAEEATDALVLHWSGVRWERVAFPKVAILEAVTVVSPTDVWAVGWRGVGMGAPTHPFAARWTGDRWRSVPIDIPIRGPLSDIVAVPGTHMLWAVGSDDVRGEGLALRWSDARWHRVRTHAQGVLRGAIAFAHSVWAVGSSRDEVLALRWNGDRWRRVDAPRGWAQSVDGLAGDNLWAVGGAPSSRRGYSRPAVFRWNGEHWLRVWAGSMHGFLNDIVVAAPGAIWAVGVRLDEPPYHPLTLQRTTDGWRASTIKGAVGWLHAIAGTPHNLWTTHAYMVDPKGSEPTYFDTYHRC